MKRKPLNVSNRWTRSAVAMLGVALFAAPGVAHAQGVTNPAQHPASIKVTIDGQTYHDGLDTLPGYDDEACTPIPNVQYDFADNQIQYYDSDGELITTANWTEWARISSYDTWKAQQNGAPASTSTPTPSVTTPTGTTPAPSNSTATTAPAATKPAATTSPATSGNSTKSTSTKSSTTTKSSSTKSSSTKSASTGSSSPSSSSTTSTSTNSASSGSSPASSTSSGTSSSSAATSGTASSSQDGAASNDAATAATPAADGTTEPVTTTTDTAVSGGAGTPVPTPGTEPIASTSGTEPTTKFKLASEHLGATGGTGDNRLAGVGILAALFGLAGFGLMFRGVARRQGFGPGSHW